MSYLFALSYCSWVSQGKNTEVVCYSLLQWTTFCQTSPPWPVHLGWLHTAWFSFIELDKAVVHVTDRLVVCECSFSLSALWWPLSVCTVFLRFLLPWMWGISSWLLQQSSAAAPYLGSRVAPLGCCPWFGRGVVPLRHASGLPLQPPCICTAIASEASNNSTTYCSSYCFCYCDRIVCMLTGKSKTIIKTNVLK